MLANLSKKVEFAANVSIIAIAVLLAVVLFRQALTVNVYPDNISNQDGQVGLRVSVPEIDWAHNKQTLLLAISSTCRYCTESSDFYKRLLKETVNTRIVAVMPQEPTAAKEYLDKHAIPLNDIRQLALSSLGVTGTPTLILVDTKGVVTGWWVGKLSPNQEAEVLGKVKS
ncbi:MAG TPA: thioredoxin fold domain-containing protein [Pyrinomonadaceae bacterium]